MKVYLEEEEVTSPLQNSIIDTYEVRPLKMIKTNLTYCFEELIYSDEAISIYERRIDDNTSGIINLIDDFSSFVENYEKYEKLARIKSKRQVVLDFFFEMKEEVVSYIKKTALCNKKTYHQGFIMDTKKNLIHSFVYLPPGNKLTYAFKTLLFYDFTAKRKDDEE